MEQANRVGKTALIRYVGGAKGEVPIDDRSTGEPLAVMLGTLQLPRGLEDAIMNMEIPCFACGEAVSQETGSCLVCGAVAFVPVGARLPARANPCDSNRALSD